MKVYVYKEYGVVDFSEFCNVEVFETMEKAKEYFKTRVEDEKRQIKSYNYEICTDWDSCPDGDFLLTNNTETLFTGYEYGYAMEYSINLEIEEKECK